MAIIPYTTKSGEKRYLVRVRGFKSKAFAKRSDATAHQAKLRLSKSRPETMTCSELVSHYSSLWEEGKLPRQKGKKPKHSTVLDRKQHYKLFEKEFGNVALENLQPLAIEAWSTSHPWAVRSVSPVFAYAVTRRLIDHNDFAQYMPHPGEGRKHIEPLTDDEVLRLAEAAGRVWPHGKAFVLWQAYTGMRPGETYALDWPLDVRDDVLLIEHGVYEGVRDTPKTGPREVFLFPQAREALALVQGIHGPVFQTVTGKRFANQHMSHTYWPKVREEFFGRDDEDEPYPKKIDVYDLRHFCAHLLFVRMSLPSTEVAAQLGNSPRLIENLYGHWRSNAASRLRQHVLANGIPVETVQSACSSESEAV